ncbi:hypothetical protein BX283_4033 [Streptomyces sp. TLI_146]|nr:hypothetical protein BX283_4033 [Streptomyces sp. TLI_146]
MSTPATCPATPVETPWQGVSAPPPTIGCDVCAALETARATARRAGDGSTVSDCNVEIRRHPHGAGVHA